MPPHLPCHCTFNLREMKIAHLFHRYHHHHCHYFITCAHDLDSMNGLKIHCKRCKKVLLAEDATIATYQAVNLSSSILHQIVLYQLKCNVPKPPYQ